RNLEDVKLRIYMRKYDRGNAYSYDLKAEQEHVLWYYQMMDVLAEKLPNIVRVIHYEETVVDPAAALRNVGELCGLPASDALSLHVGDDRECAAPYRKLIAVGLK